MEIGKRTFFIDLLKFLALIFMPILHSFAAFATFETMGEQYPYDALETVMNVLYWFTPSIFMLCMSFGLHFARRREPADFAKRGLRLLLLFVVLNFLRYPLPTLIQNLFCGGLNGEWLVESVEWLLGNDILAFAGLFFLLYAVIRKITKSDIVLLAVGVLLFVVSTLIPTDITVENGILECFLSNFIYTEDTYFTIFNWFIIPVIGYVFYKYFAKSQNKDRFMVWTFAVSALLFAGTYTVLSCTGLMQERYFMWGEGEFLFDIPTMLFLMEINFLYIPVIHFAAKLVQKSKILVGLISFEAKNMNRIYCIHWVILMFLFIFLGQSGLLTANSAVAPFALGIALLAVSSLVAFFYVKIKARLAGTRKNLPEQSA